VDQAAVTMRRGGRGRRVDGGYVRFPALVLVGSGQGAGLQLGRLNLHGGGSNLDFDDTPTVMGGRIPTLVWS